MRTSFSDECDLDRSVAYTVRGWGAGIAWRLLGYAVESVPVMGYFTDDEGEEYEAETGECEDVPDESRVVVVMIGDDRRFTVDADDITPLAREDYCGECGQVGCTHDGLDR